MERFLIQKITLTKHYNKVNFKRINKANYLVKRSAFYEIMKYIVTLKIKLC